MRIVNFRAEGYRCLRQVELTACSPFNVLIGKNNSGKSTVLSAIRTFFRVLEVGDVVSTTFPAKARDFTNRMPGNDIVLSCDMALGESERSKIISDMAEELPQLQTAIEALSSTCYATIELILTPPPRAFCYVRQICLSSEDRNGVASTLIDVSRTVAQELFDAVSAARTTDEATSFLNRLRTGFDDDDWRISKRNDRVTGPRSGTPLGAYFRRFLSADDSELQESLQRALNQSDSFEEFRGAISEVAADYAKRRSAFLGKQLSIPVKTFSGEERTVPQYVRSFLKRVAATKVLYLTEYRKQIGSEEAQRLLDLKTKRGGMSTLSNIQAAVSDLLGVKVDAFSSDEPTPDRPGPHAELDVDDFLVEMNGSGIREALRLVLDTAFEKPSVLLVEEPEIHLHPALESSMMRFLQTMSDECQIIITTHSTNFLDRGGYQNVYLVSKNSSTVLERLDVEAMERTLPDELGLRLSSLFMYDVLVFVEGPSDELVLRELGNRLRVNLSRRTVGFVHLNGVGNLRHYSAQEVMSFLSKRRVKMFFIIDRDERADQELRIIKDRMGASAVLFPTLPRELENYLLVAPAIALALRSRMPAADNHPDAGVIASDLQECADELKRYTIVKHATAVLRPMYPPRVHDLPEEGVSALNIVKAHLEDLNKQAHAQLEGLEEKVGAIEQTITQNWQRDKLVLVPGAMLLDRVYQRYGLRFDKLRDGPRIAAEVAATEIDRDLQSLISLIGSD